MLIASEKHMSMSTGVDAFETNHPVTSKSQVYDIAAGKYRKLVEFGSSKSQT